MKNFYIKGKNLHQDWYNDNQKRHILKQINKKEK